jgi:hypothetical protein
MLGRVPGISEPAIFWFSGYRQADPALQACLDELSTEWPRYVARAQGTFIRNATARVEEVRFFGVEEKLTQICINEKK